MHKVLPITTTHTHTHTHTHVQVFEETFEFGVCDNENFVRLLSECDVGSATSEQLNTWYEALTSTPGPHYILV